MRASRQPLGVFEGRGGESDSKVKEEGWWWWAAIRESGSCSSGSSMSVRQCDEATCLGSNGASGEPIERLKSKSGKLGD